MKDLLSDLNEDQKRAVMQSAGPLLIVAGAGTGKTTVITRRIGYFIDQKIAKSDRILALTFTEKAAGELVERIDTLLPYGYVDLWVHTFHSFCQRILETHGVDIGLPYNFKVLDQTQQWILMYNNFNSFKLDYYRPLGNPTKFLHALVQHFSRLKDESIWPEEYLRYAEELKLNNDSPEFLASVIPPDAINNLSKKEKKELAMPEIKKIQELANAYHTYQQLTLANNSLDFGDLIMYCLKLFKERPKILLQYRTQFSQILVDEFQDTNWAQYELIKLLSHPKNNLTVCGDDDQSIYKFRGASVSNILQFEKDYPALKKVYLIKNYRSRQNILDFAYKFIQNNNPNRLEVSLKNEKNFSKKLLAQNPGEGTVEYYEFETQEEEMNGVIGAILDLKSKNSQTTWSDFAVLVRANSYADIFNYGFSQAKIPFQFVASRGLYSKAIVLDILAWIKLLDNYHESPALFRILSLPMFSFTQKEIINLNYWSKRKGRSLYQTLLSASTFEEMREETVKKANAVLQLIEKHTKMLNARTVKEIIYSFLEESKYLRFLAKEDSLEARQQLNFLNQFYKKISDFEQNTPDASVKNFLRIIELEIQAGEEGTLQAMPELEGPEAVKVMTIHAAKGLEFKYVFIVNMVERRFPTIERKDPIEIPDALVREIVPQGEIHLEEERRLLYVGSTRAKEGLWLTGAKDYGGARQKKPSIFIKEFGILPSPLKKYSERNLEVNIASKEYYKMPDKFSFSQLKAFNSCPWQYRLAFILKVPVKGKFVFSFGKSMHMVMQRIFERVRYAQSLVQADLFSKSSRQASKIIKECVSLEEINKIYSECFIDDWYESEEQKNSYFKKGKEILKDYYQEIQDQSPKPLHLEKSFNIKIQDNDKGSEYSIFGVIDRVDESGDGIEIIDYKTGRSKSAITLDDKEQLLLYQLAAKEIFSKPVKKLTFHYLEENKKNEFLGQEKDLKALKEKIIFAIHEIEKGEFAPKPGPLCKYCDFFDICEHRSV